MMPDGLRRLLFGMAGALYPKLAQPQQFPDQKGYLGRSLARERARTLGIPLLEVQIWCRPADPHPPPAIGT